MEFIGNEISKRLEKLEEDNPSAFTTIAHRSRLKLGLTNNEYCIADMVYHLSNNPENRMGRWCYASKEYLGDFIGISKQSVHKLIKGLILKGIIEKHPVTRFLRTSQLWYDTAVREKDALKRVAVKKVNHG